MKVMIICHLYGPPWNEGVKNMVRVLVERLTDFGIDVEVYSKGGRGTSRTPSIRFAPLILAGDLLFWWRATRRARAQRVEVIHLLSSVTSILGLKCSIIRILSRTPLLLHITGINRPIFGYNFLLRADGIMVGGAYLRKLFPVSIEFHPVSPYLNPADAPQHCRLIFNSQPRKVLYLGAMEAVRGVHTLVDACAELITHFRLEDFAITIAWNGHGDLDYVRKIRKKITAYRIQKHFQWRKLVNDVPSLYQEHDFVVIPRDTDERMGIPLCLIEAMSYGRPVIVSNIGEMSRIAEGCGLVFSSGDSFSLATALHRLLTDSDFYQECAQNGFRKAAQFHPQRVVRPLVNIYKELAHDS
jgi:glycosyltransferase involved in cell wall biosynthesis